MLFKVQCIEHHTGSNGRPESVVNSSRASFGSGDKSTRLVDQRPKGISNVALRYWIWLSEKGVARESDSGMTKAETQVDDRKAAALVKPRMLVATTTRKSPLKEGL